MNVHVLICQHAECIIAQFVHVWDSLQIELSVLSFCVWTQLKACYNGGHDS